MSVTSLFYNCVQLAESYILSHIIKVTNKWNNKWWRWLIWKNWKRTSFNSTEKNNGVIKCRVYGPVDRQLALPVQQFCVPLVGGQSSSYSARRGVVRTNCGVNTHCKRTAGWVGSSKSAADKGRIKPPSHPPPWAKKRSSVGFPIEAANSPHFANLLSSSNMINNTNGIT